MGVKFRANSKKLSEEVNEKKRIKGSAQGGRQ
jgi:hypothetical protein